jgi:hypothetical protein
MRYRLVLTAAVGMLWAALAAPTGAAPLEHEHYAGSDSFTVEDFCGTDWSVEATFEGNFMLKAGRRGDATPYFFDNYRYREVWTDMNDATRQFIHEGNALWRDHRITLVEGTTYHFVVHESGAPSVGTTMDGRFIFRDRGTIVWEFTVDTKGDDDLGNDEFVSDEGPTAIHGPHPELLADDPQRCAWIEESIGD